MKRGSTSQGITFVLSQGKLINELKWLREIFVKGKQLFLELVSLDLVLHSESKRRKYKIMALSVLIPILFGGIRIYIKGHYTDFPLWFGIAAVLALLTWLYFLWIIEGWTNFRVFLTVGSLLPLTIMMYGFFINVVFSFSLRRLIFSVMFLVVLLILLLLVYFVGLMANVLNTYMFKHVELGKVALGGLLFLYIFLYMIVQATLFLGVIYVIEGKAQLGYSLLIGLGFILVWVWINVSIMFILWRSLGLALLWGGIFGIIGVILPLTIFIVKGDLLFTVVIIILLPWVIWETIELLVFRTRELNWWSIILALVLIVLFFIIF